MGDKPKRLAEYYKAGKALNIMFHDKNINPPYISLFRLHFQPTLQSLISLYLCEKAPAHVTFKADAAVLCVTCDRDIHSANPQACLHKRVPVTPFYDSVNSVPAVEHNKTFLVEF
ncbi:hypothetical protein CCACVL1_22834 [Corchorus capsularis]|uniref:Uncharacterized protein n=1 Tax=Corchorus capsularis TaxID=210143 RepID=A0A1R3GWD6_COCAP|nr:hypothetical protein CCACVL1_22834 [Corchorus capsularis]